MLNKKIEPKTQGQRDYVESIYNNTITFATGPAGCGKSLRNSEIVYTPNGPIKNGSVSVGDKVLTPDGKSANVLGVYPQGEIDVYRVTFSDGSTVDCSADHLWTVEDLVDSRKAIRTLETKEIINIMSRTTRADRRFAIETCLPASFNQEDELPIDPYLLGILIGDGGLTRGVMVSSGDEFILNEIKDTIPNNLELKRVSNYDYRISSGRSHSNTNTILEKLRKLGLMGKMSVDKFIPNQYLFASIENRVSLLQGLMDSDGTVDKLSGMPRFCTSSENLSNNFKFLIESLGGLVSINLKETTHKPTYIITVQMNDKNMVFRLPRKLKLAKNRTKYLTKRYIRSVEHVGKDECTCIYIDHPDHLYLTNNFIATHNTILAVRAAAEHLIKGKVKKLILCRPAVAAGEKLGFLPGDLQQKVDPYLRPIYDYLEMFFGQNYQKYANRNYIEVTPIAFMRGRSLSNCFILMDEAQNATIEQMKMFLTRIDDGSKMIINGDITQNDLPSGEKSGLSHASEILRNINDIGWVDLKPIDIQRHPLVTKIVEKYEGDV